MIARARGVERFEASRRNAAILTVAGAAGACLASVPLALASWGTPASSRTLLAGVLAVGVVAAWWTRSQPWQFDVETPTRWLERGAARAALLNGLMLGAGAFTRMGFWLAWLLPVALFASGPGWAVAIATLYGVTRLGLSSLLTRWQWDASGPLMAQADLIAAAATGAAAAYLTAAALVHVVNSG